MMTKCVPNLAGIGLMFHNAKWYDPGINHFTQPDSIVPDSYNPLDWNRYSYVRYNPLKYTDPSGHDPKCGPDGIWCGTDGSGYAGGTGSKGGGGGDNSGSISSGGGGNGNSGSSSGGNAPTGDHTVLVTNLSTLDLIFDPFYGPVWYKFTQESLEYLGHAFEYRHMLRELMKSGLYGSDSYAGLRLQVALALPQAGGKPGSNNVIPTSIFSRDLLVTRVGWEPYDTFLDKLGLGTGHDNAANYEPYFLQGLMNSEVGRIALEAAKKDYLVRRSLSGDAEILEYLMGTCSGCAGP